MAPIGEDKQDQILEQLGVIRVEIAVLRERRDASDMRLLKLERAVYGDGSDIGLLFQVRQNSGILKAQIKIIWTILATILSACAAALWKLFI